MNRVFIFDTYAIIEVIAGNKNYEKYLDSEVIINEFIFAELCYNLIKEKGIEKSNLLIDKYQRFVLNASPKIIKDAMLFRFENRKKDLSMTDCISYIMAQKSNIRFLTGDKEFKNMDNVEFLK